MEAADTPGNLCLEARHRGNLTLKGTLSHLTYCLWQHRHLPAGVISPPMAGGHLLPLTKGDLGAEGSSASRPEGLLSIGRNGAELTLNRGSCGAFMPSPMSEPFGEVTRTPTILKRAERSGRGRRTTGLYRKTPRTRQVCLLRATRGQASAIPECPGSRKCLASRKFPAS